MAVVDPCRKSVCRVFWLQDGVTNQFIIKEKNIFDSAYSDHRGIKLALQELAAFHKAEETRHFQWILKKRKRQISSNIKKNLFSILQYIIACDILIYIKRETNRSGLTCNGIWMPHRKMLNSNGKGAKGYDKVGRHEEEEPGDQAAGMGEIQQTVRRVRKQRQWMAESRIYGDNRRKVFFLPRYIAISNSMWYNLLYKSSYGKYAEL